MHACTVSHHVKSSTPFMTRITELLGESLSLCKGSPIMAIVPLLDHSRIKDPSKTDNAETTVINPLLVLPSVLTA